MNATNTHVGNEVHAGALLKVTSLLRRHMLMIALLALIAPSYFAWSWNAELGQLGSDGPSYLMMANHYAHGNSGDPVYSDYATYSRFPPLYPLLLAWSHAADNFHLIHAVTTACLILALGALYAWLLVQGLSPSESALLAFLFALIPGTWLAALTVQSEYLYLFWSLLALCLLTAQERSKNPHLLYAAGMAIAMAILTRSIGIALLPAFGLLLLRAPRRNAILALLIAALPVLTWSLLHRSRAGYTDALAQIYSRDGLSTLKSQLVNELPALRQGFSGNFALQDSLRWLFDVLGLLCLGATLLRAIRTKPDAVYVVCNLAILLVWPYPEEAQRFLWVLVPLLIAQPILLATRPTTASYGSRGSQYLTAAAAAAILVGIIPACALASDRYRAAFYTDLPESRFFVAWYGQDQQHGWDVATMQTAMMNSMRSIADSVPATDCVIATRPDLINYLGRRRSYLAPLNSIPDPWFLRRVLASGCHFVFGMSTIDGRYPVPLFPVGRLGTNVKVILYNNIPDEHVGKSRLTSVLARLK